MNLVINNLAIPIEQDGIEQYLVAASKKMQVDVADLVFIEMLSKALDLRNKEQFFYKISLVVCIADTFTNRQGFSIYPEAVKVNSRTVEVKDRPIIIGFGPAGMFAALELIALGIKPLIFERGKMIEERSLDVQNFIKNRVLNPESNIQFGEGGAGSYSDGKLFSRRNKNTSYVNRVLQTFIKFGAPEEIGYISKPHLGTDVLCMIVRNIRRHILERGGEIFYGSKMTDLLIVKGRACGVVVNNEHEYLSSDIYIALGHSARETFKMMHKKGVAVEQRAISLGVRIEHPVEIINRLRYGDKYKDFPGLGAATYSLNYTNKQIRKGVYTFCMCPGGEIVNASSAPGRLVLNGMSYSQRASKFSNAALAVSCHVCDYNSADPLAGIEFQERVERSAFKAGGGNWRAPAQNLLNFLGVSGSTELPGNSYKMGVVSTDLQEIFPGFVIEHLLAAFAVWKKEVPLFIAEQAILLAAETRTSSPVRITRDDNFESINVKNLYPIGEGAGYAGGITSSAADAIRAVEKHFTAK